MYATPEKTGYMEITVNETLVHSKKVCNFSLLFAAFPFKRKKQLNNLKII